MKKVVIIIGSIILLLLSSDLPAQVPGYPQPPILINRPTAGSLERASYSIEMRMMPAGGVLSSIGVGISDRFLLGLSYGGSNIVGEDTVQWNPEPGVQVKYRLFEETYSFPAVSFGYNSQGYHSYIDSLDRYEIKSTGLFVVMSKNYQFLGNLGLHAGINYSFETGDGDKDPNIFFGIDKDINQDLALMLEYDAALNDNRSGDVTITKSRGYLNAGIRWTFAERFHVEFDVNNILRNKQYGGSLPSREIKILYVEQF